jgi:hypothetical protein
MAHLVLADGGYNAAVVCGLSTDTRTTRPVIIDDDTFNAMVFRSAFISPLPL